MQRPPLLLVFEVRVMFGFHPPPTSGRVEGETMAALVFLTPFHGWGLWGGVGWIASQCGARNKRSLAASFTSVPAGDVSGVAQRERRWFSVRQSGGGRGRRGCRRRSPPPPPPHDRRSLASIAKRRCIVSISISHLQQYLSLAERQLPVTPQIAPCFTRSATACHEGHKAAAKKTQLLL